MLNEHVTVNTDDLRVFLNNFFWDTLYALRGYLPYSSRNGSYFLMLGLYGP